MAKKVASNEPVPMEAVAILCAGRECLGFKVVEVTRDEADTGHLKSPKDPCPICNSSLYYGKVLRNPSSADVKIALLERERDQARRERDKAKVEAREAQIKVDAINQTLDKLGRLEMRHEGLRMMRGPWGW